MADRFLFFIWMGAAGAACGSAENAAVHGSDWRVLFWLAGAAVFLFMAIAAFIRSGNTDPGVTP